MTEPRAVPSRRDVLRSATLLRALTEDQQVALAGTSRMASAEKGETIWNVGAEVDFFGIVGTGFVKITTRGPNHQEITTEIVGPGQVFGLLGVLNGRGCPRTAKAVVGTWYLKVRTAEFLPIYAANPLLKEHIFHRTAMRLHQAFDLSAHLSAGTVEQRVAAVLLTLSQSFGQAQEGGIMLEVPLTRQDLSELAGTTVESTIRVVSRWQKQGWIETQAKHIVLRDVDSLMLALR